MKNTEKMIEESYGRAFGNDSELEAGLAIAEQLRIANLLKAYQLGLIPDPRKEVVEALLSPEKATEFLSSGVERTTFTK